MLSPATLMPAVLFAGGVVLCKHVVARLPKDLADYCDGASGVDRGVIVFFWVITAAVIFFLVDFVLGLIGRFG